MKIRMRDQLEDVDIVDAAYMIAVAAHETQVDKAGAAYIEHPRRVAERVAGDDDAMAVAWLHDVLEDSEWGIPDLEEWGIPYHIILAVDLLSKDGGSWVTGTIEEYYGRVRSNALALKVKLADIADNTHPDRLALLPEDVQLRLRKKYVKALYHLTGGE
jgi:hypothetical protein